MNFNAIEEIIKYSFKDKSLLADSLTHSSFSNESKLTVTDNERLEFLGDSILGFITARYLYTKFSKVNEGELTKARAALVCEKSLCVYANSFSLGNLINMGKGEERGGGRNRPSIISDAFEALLAAIYLDGGMDAAEAFIVPFLKEHGTSALKGKLGKDYKTVLQEIVQRNKTETIEYVIAEEEGPAHERVFKVNLLLNTNILSTGRGKSKKEAEQQAAKEALALMGEE